MSCQKKSDNTTNPTSTTTATSATASAAATASAKPAWKDLDEDDRIASADVLPPGKPVDTKTLALFDLPPPPAGIPSDAIWSSVDAEKDGHRHNVLTKDKEMWAGFEFYDCRSELVHKYAGKPIKDTGEMGYCFVTLPDTYKTYPSFKREKGSVANAISSAMRVIRAGNMILIVSAFTRKDEWLLAQLDTAIKDLDLAAIAKW